jgi:hypothetical protein
MPMTENEMKNAVSKKNTNLLTEKGTNGLLVIFSCNTCPYVIKNEARITAICTYAKKNNFGVIILNSNEAKRSNDDSEEAMKKYAEKQKYDWSYVIDTDSKMADAFGANRTPECFLFNKDSKLAYHGAIDDSPADENAVNRKHLQIAIDELTAGKTVSVTETKSIGCTIKRKS